MAASLMGELASGVADLLNAHTWSAGFEFKAVAGYKPQTPVEQTEDYPVVTVTPERRVITLINRGGVKRHEMTVDVVLQQQHGDGVVDEDEPGEVGPADRCDIVTAKAQELEDFLLNPVNVVTVDSLRAVPLQAEAELMDDERLEKHGIVAVNLKVTYTLLR